MNEVLSLRWVGHVEAEAGWSLPQQKLTWHELTVICEGVMLSEVNGARHLAHAGDVLFYPRDAMVDESNASPQRLCFYILSFTGDLPQVRLPEVVNDTRGRLQALAQWIFEEWRSWHPEAITTRNSLFAAFWQQWLHLAAHADQPLVETIRVFVRRYIDQPITLQDLADQVELSRFHLVRRFQALTGRTPMEEVRLLRVAHAEYLLASTDLPLKAIPARAGLGDQYQMCRLFRKYRGTTPGAMRAMLRKNTRRTRIR